MAIPDLEQYITWDTDPITQAQYADIVQTSIFNAKDPRETKFMYWYLRARHLAYFPDGTKPVRYHNGIAIDPGGCAGKLSKSGSLTTVGDISKGIQIGTLGAGIALQAGKALELLAQRGLAALNMVPIVGTIANLVIAPLTFILGKHAQAVKVESQTLCQFTTQINQLIDEININVSKGSITLAQADQAWSNLENGFTQALAQITHKCNAGCYEEGFLHGLHLLYIKYIYPMELTASQTAKVGVIGALAAFGFLGFKLFSKGIAR
jgi:hypothetical protein